MPAALRRWPWADVLLAAFALAVIWRLSRGFFNPTDFVAWSADANVLRGCLVDVHIGTCAGLSKFPLAYLANAHLVGGSQERLAAINTIALLLPVVSLGVLRGWRLMLRGGAVYLLALVLSPLPAFYVRSGALEIQAGVVSGIFMACLANVLFGPSSASTSQPTRVLLALSGLLLALYKDTVVALLGVAVVAVWFSRPWWESGAETLPSLARIRTLACYAVLPVSLGLVALLAYNLYRYDSVLPVAYIQEAAHTTPSLRHSMEFFFGSIMSPNGGVVVFWALPFAVALIGWRLRGLRIDRSTAALAGVAAFLSCLTFARWWAPFGWDAWGDRLMIQPMLAVLVGCFLNISPSPGSIGRTAVPSVATMLFAVPVLVASTYYVMVPYVDGRGESLGDSLWPGPACDQMMHRLQTDAPGMGFEFWTTDDYYRCARERMLHVPAPKFE